MITEALAGLLGGGVVAAAERLLPRRALRQPKVPEAICGCEHHLSMHDPKTGACHAQVETDEEIFTHDNRFLAYKVAQCPCRHYVGPQPLAMVYAPEITP
jgi:hypothetical protein